MNRMLVPLVTILAVPLAYSLVTANPNTESIREQFLEIAKLQELTRDKIFWLSDNHDKELIRQANDADRALLSLPKAEVLSTIDQSIRSGEKLEVSGALIAYSYLIVMNKFTPELQYKPLLLDMLARDDFKSRTYTNAVAGALGWYRSRETMLAYMDAAKRAPDVMTRDEFVDSTAAMLDIQLHYTLSDPTPDRKRRAIAEFEAWYEKNQDKIRFDKRGEPHFPGSPGEWKPPKLSSEDRERIKKNPVCVLKLFDSMMDPQNEAPGEFLDLNGKCGQALLGEEGSSLVAKTVLETKNGYSPGLEREMALAAARDKYPVMSAVLTAAAYVAANEEDPQARGLAKRILDNFGQDLEEVLKQEPRWVRQGVQELLGAEVPGK
jgi:hypothetical protein